MSRHDGSCEPSHRTGRRHESKTVFPRAIGLTTVIGEAELVRDRSSTGLTSQFDNRFCTCGQVVEGIRDGPLTTRAGHALEW